jgi:hypothetical protein
VERRESARRSFPSRPPFGDAGVIGTSIYLTAGRAVRSTSTMHLEVNVDLGIGQPLAAGAARLPGEGAALAPIVDPG